MGSAGVGLLFGRGMVAAEAPHGGCEHDSEREQERRAEDDEAEQERGPVVQKPLKLPPGTASGSEARDVAEEVGRIMLDGIDHEQPDPDEQPGDGGSLEGAERHHSTITGCSPGCRM